MTDKLLPCPHCGSTALKTVGNGIGDTWIECMSCGCGTGLSESHKANIDAWNRRVVAPTQGADDTQVVIAGLNALLHDAQDEIERLTAAQGADARPVAIYQSRLHTDDERSWSDCYEATFYACKAYPDKYATRIVYATLVAAPIITPESVGLPSYPSGHVVGPCVCGSWPGGACLKCKVIPARDAAPSVTQEMVWSAYNMCPDHVQGQPARMRWMAEFINAAIAAIAPREET
jgi:Lar family restriction alleviation protein